MRWVKYRRLEPGVYELGEDVQFDTPIVGHIANIKVSGKRCYLTTTGALKIDSGFLWDLASGAVDTPDMVIASLAHDALCEMVEREKLPRSVQKQADKYFRQVLKEEGCSALRRWYAYIAVRFFQTVVG